MAFVSTTVALVATVLAFIYLLIKWNYSYWERRGVPTIPASFPFGNLGPLGKIHSHSTLMGDIYYKLKALGPFCGMYSFHKPLALITDLDLIKKVLTNDFTHFHDRGIYHNAKADPLSANLLSIEGKQWRDLRSKLTQTFTSGKMKLMYPLICDVAEQLKLTITKMTEVDDGVMEMKDLLSSFTTDCLGVCGFGLECNSFDGPDVQFRVIGKKIFERPRNTPAKQLLISSFQNIARFFNARVVSEDVEEFYMSIVRKTVDYREKNNVHRFDLLDIMIGLKNSSDVNSRITFNQIVAETFSFFLAGFGTTSTMMSFTIHELALNPEMQTKLRNQMREVLARHNGEITMEATTEMTYLEMVFCEALRKYPPFGNLIRVCSKDYAVPGTKHTIQKGVGIWVPIYAIQRDPEFYPDPERFNPDRFLPEEVEKRNPITYMPFGDGPRQCIGIRFAMMKARVALVTLLMNFEFSVCEKTLDPLHISKKTFLYTPEDGVWLKVKKLL